jgi:hypothetical protein
MLDALRFQKSVYDTSRKARLTLTGKSSLRNSRAGYK